MIRVAAEAFSVTPSVGAPSDSRTGHGITAVFSPLDTTIFLLDDGKIRLCVVTSEFYVDYYGFSNRVRQELGPILGIGGEKFFVFSSHDHSCSMYSTTSPFPDGFPNREEVLTKEQLTPDGVDLFDKLKAAAARLPGQLKPAQVFWGVGHERRVPYNRKGRRADGSAYLIREEDRALLGQDFNGDIDDDAPVIAFRGLDGKPIGFLVQYTAHPVTAYHPERPIIFGDYPHVACHDLSEAHGNVPVGFMQGCAGEMNSKGFLADLPFEEKVRNATQYGHYLGEAYLKAARELKPSRREDLGFLREGVKLPFQKVPSVSSLKKDLKEVDDFLERCARNDENTRACVGLNFPKALSPKYRSTLVEPSKRWTEWALSLHEQNKLNAIRKFVEMDVAALRIGDVGVVGLACEPFLGIGRQIRKGAMLPLIIPCGYMDSNIAYVQDSPNVGDRDYSSSYYRYTDGFLPYKKPAGDLLARAGLRMLRKLSKHSRSA